MTNDAGRKPEGALYGHTRLYFVFSLLGEELEG
jgi:hypothetical protein